jgi:hypothetical protein
MRFCFGLIISILLNLPRWCIWRWWWQNEAILQNEDTFHMSGITNIRKYWKYKYTYILNFAFSSVYTTHKKKRYHMSNVTYALTDKCDRPSICVEKINSNMYSDTVANYAFPQPSRIDCLASKFTWFQFTWYVSWRSCKGQSVLLSSEVHRIRYTG